MISSMAFISSSSSATVRVEKATSDLLIRPDWTLNMEICDVINSNRMLAKDVVKAVKKRLQHKNPQVQLLSLTLLETMIKNCGDYVHFQIVEKNVLQEMVKIVKKKTDMHVRDKVLNLISSWNEAFGGSEGRFPQYCMVYEDLRRFGVQFPQRPIFTPAAMQAVSRPSLIGNGMPSSSAARPDEARAAEESLSLSSLNSMRNVVELLSDMLRAVDPSNPWCVKDEVIVELVKQCRVNQRKLMQLLGTTGDEELLCKGLDLNDNLQSVIVKHDAIACGCSPQKHESGLRSPAKSKEGGVVEQEEEEDEFAQLARRHSKARPAVGNALVVPMETKDENIMELLSIVLSTDRTSQASSSPSTSEVNPSSNNNYVAPWAQQQQQPEPYACRWSQPEQQPNKYTTAQPSPLLHVQPQNPQYACPPPPRSAISSNNGEISGAVNQPFIPSYRLFEDLDVFGYRPGVGLSGWRK